MIKFLSKLIPGLVFFGFCFFLPKVSLAATTPTTFKGLVELFVGFLNTGVSLLVSLAILAFLWGLTKFFLNSSNKLETEKARDIMVYGVIGIFVIVSMWAFVNFLSSTLLFGRAPTTRGGNPIDSRGDLVPGSRGNPSGIDLRGDGGPGYLGDPSGIDLR